MDRILLVLFALTISASAARAQSTVSPNVYKTPATVGATDSTIVAAGSVFYFLDLVNDSPTATICINFGAVATISGTTCAAGEITLPPLWHRSWENNLVPNDAIHAIASAGATPMTLGTK